MCFEVQLIMEVQAHECLYNIKSKEYRNSNKKEYIWVKIAQNLDANGKKYNFSEICKYICILYLYIIVDTCKARWKSLRDKFVKERKVRDMPSGSGAPLSQCRWKFYDSLAFLSDSVQHRK